MDVDEVHLHDSRARVSPRSPQAAVVLNVTRIRRKSDERKDNEFSKIFQGVTS